MTEALANRTTAARDPLLIVEGVSKLFGGDEAAAAKALANGAAREDVHSRFGAFAAVADVSFAVEPGEIFVIMGLSGSGKSTLLRCLNRLIEPSAGQIRFQGEEITSLAEARLRTLRLSKISMVFQHFALLPHRTVIENVGFGLKMRGMARKERDQIAERLIEQVGLSGWEQRYPHNLSGGMKQRVGLARSLAVDPDLLLMDEAFSALDPVIRRDMQQELLRLQQKLAKTIIFITHDIQEALLLGDRIAMMKDGRIVQIGSPADLILRPATPFVADFTRDADRGRLLRARDIMAASEAEGASEERKRLHLVSGAVRVGQVKAAPAAGQLSVGHDQKLASLLECCRSAAPIMVLGDDGSIVGTLDRERLLAVLAPPQK